MLDFTIRDAVESDTARIAALVSELGYPTTDAEMKSRLATIWGDSNLRTLVAQVGTVVVGVAGVGLAPNYERNGAYGRLLVLAVAEPYRGSGVGRALVDKAETWLTTRGATTIVVNSGDHRKDV
jgi:GNAT superfamily N-acetyltransferase